MRSQWSNGRRSTGRVLSTVCGRAALFFERGISVKSRTYVVVERPLADVNEEVILIKAVGSTSALRCGCDDCVRHVVICCRQTNAPPDRLFGGF
jgi:hypothetical protein